MSMRVGCGGDASTLDGMTAAEIIAAASGGGGGGDTIVEYELTSTEFIDVDQWAPSGGDGSVTLLVAQDATGYHSGMEWGSVRDGGRRWRVV